MLVDDRPQISAEVTFTDAELIGIPRIVVLGRRLAEGYVEVRDRRTGERTDVPLADVASLLSPFRPVTRPWRVAGHGQG